MNIIANLLWWSGKATRHWCTTTTTMYTCMLYESGIAGYHYSYYYYLEDVPQCLAYTVHDDETRTKLCTHPRAETAESIWSYLRTAWLYVYNAKAYGYMLPIYYLSKMYLSIFRQDESPHNVKNGNGIFGVRCTYEYCRACLGVHLIFCALWCWLGTSSREILNWKMSRSTM